MKRIFILSLIILLSLPILGNPVDENTAKQLAQNFWKENNIMGVKGNKVFKKKMDDARFLNVAPQCGYTEFYIFNNEDGKGFVIIAADDCVTPILGYSYDNNFATENLPPNLKGWLDGYAEQIRKAVEMRATATEEIRTEWDCLRQGRNLPIKSETEVDHLLSTTWGQGEYYNMLCPEDNYGIGGHALTGCVATAMAQILKFWEYPNDAHSVIWHEYEHPVYGTLDANYSYSGGSYYWSFMPDQLTSSSSTNQIIAVASLMYHCGVSVEMNYGRNISLAYNTAAEIAFRAFFDYNDATLITKSSYTDAQWISLLKIELDNGRPVYYAGSGQDGGHAFVCDGYNNSNFFWFNWGWSGQADGFFPISSLTPTTQNGYQQYQHNYSNNQQAIIGIEPGGTNNYHLLGLNDDIRINGDNEVFYFDTQIQEITTEVYNWGNEAFNGSLCAVVYDGGLQYVAASEFIDNCQILPMQSSGQLSFTFSESLNIITSEAYVGIYSIENNQPSLVSSYGMHQNPGIFENLYSFSESIVELFLYSNIEYSPTTIVQNSAINVTASIINDDFDLTFIGDFAAALYSLDGELKQVLATLHESIGLPPGYYYLNPLNFSCPSVNVPTGTYYLTIIQKPDGSNNWYPLQSWGDPEYVNPIRVEVVNTVTATANPNNGGTVSFNYDFDDGTMMGWTSIDADGDGYGWESSTTPYSYFANSISLSGSGHNSSEAFVVSGSYSNNYGALVPDNYLVSPLVQLGGNITFYACAQDANYPAEHFGVAVSTSSNTNALAFSMVQEWTMTAKDASSVMSTGRDGSNRSQGNWYQYTVDLSTYSGLGYVAIRHFNCTDQFVLDIDDISLSTGNGGIPICATFNQSQSCTVQASPNSGYTFVNWTENGTQVSTDASYTFTVNGNRNLVANFQAQSQQYTITVSASPSNGGNVSGGGIFTQGQTCTVNASANSGYTFVNWTENGTQVSTNANYTFTVTGNRSLVANFQAQTQQYTISVSASPSNGGSVSGGGTFTQGQTCTVNATANSGYTFVNWTENGTQVSTNPSYSFTVNGNRNLVANFQAQSQQYTISVSASPSNGGNVSGGGTFTQGQTCTVNATANSGYTFVNWTENGTQVSTNASYSFTVTNNRNLVANFAQSTYTITATAGANGFITPSGTVVVAEGSDQTFTIIPDYGYEIYEVYVDGGLIGAPSSYTFQNVTSNHTIFATFIRIDGIDDNNSMTFVLYPNPTSGIVNILCHDAELFNIYNTYGQLLISQNTNGNDQVTIDLSNLPSGIYLIQIVSKGGLATKQIIKIP